MDDGMSRLCEYGEVHYEPVTNSQDILSVKRFQRAQTDWANLVNSGSKYFEDRHDHDFLENVFPIVHLRIQQADISGKLYDVALCRAVSGDCSIMNACGVAGKVAAARSPWQAQETVINTSFLERTLSRKKVPQDITMTVLQGLAAFNQTVSEDESRVTPPRSHQTQGTTSTATVWELVEDPNSSVVQQFFCINGAVTERQVASRDKIPSSLLHSVSKKYVSPADLAMRSLMTSLMIVRSQFFEVSHAGAETGDVGGDLRQENLLRHQQPRIGRGMLLAISVFLDVFPEALSSPDVPLRQLDADSLLLSELADALTKTCKKVVKVVDLFSYNTLVDVLHHVFEL